MNKIVYSFLIAGLFSVSGLFAQNNNILIDGQMEDWTDAVFEKSDSPEDTPNYVDFTKLNVAHNKDFLFVKFEVLKEIDLLDFQKIFLYIDTDNNKNTGQNKFNTGADLIYDFGNGQAQVYINGQSKTLNWDALHFNSLPTVTATQFEFAISRHSTYNGQALFSSDTIQLFISDEYNGQGDVIPDEQAGFFYVFDPSANTGLPDIITMEKEKPEYLRLLTYNVLQNGLTDLSRSYRFKRILKAVQPDIITFNECWDISAGVAKDFVNESLPLDNDDEKWYALRKDGANITVSRFPFSDSWLILPDRRLTAGLIDLPDSLYATDLMVVNAHLKCCEGDELRQREADAFAAFILDAKTEGGSIDLPENTPFILSGDLNLVGKKEQRQTLLTGTIVNTTEFGQGGKLDWDDTDLYDIVSLNTGLPFAYTWYDEGSSYSPGRLDYHICSNSVLQIEKTFTLQTEFMSEEDLTMYGLQKKDTGLASDHLPKVTDFGLTLQNNTFIRSNEEKTYKNPLLLDVYTEQNHLYFIWNSNKPYTNQTLGIALYDLKGSLVFIAPLNTGQNSLRLKQHLQKGIYLWQIIDNNTKRAVQSGRVKGL